MVHTLLRNSLLRVYPKENIINVFTDLATKIFIETLFVILKMLELSAFLNRGFIRSIVVYP